MIPTDYVNTNSKHENLRSALFEEVEEGYRAIHNLIDPAIYRDESPLPKLLQEGAGHSQSALGRIYRYAYLGEIDDLLHHDDLHDAIAFVVACRPLAELYDLGVPELAESALNIAIARAKIDSARGVELPFDHEFWGGMIPYADERRLTVREMGWLARMSERSVRNAMLEGDDRLEVIKDGFNVFVDPTTADTWLARRRGYVPTRIPRSSPDDSVLVPVAKDGSIFSAQCRRSQGYQIGKKGGEQYIEDIWEARDALERMNKPYWRRPNEHGRFGIVTGLRWESIPKEQFLGRTTKEGPGEEA